MAPGIRDALLGCALLSLAACGGPASRAAPAVSPVTGRLAATEAPPSTPPPARPSPGPAIAPPADVDRLAPADQWPFLAQAIGSCVRDGLAGTPYLAAWYARARLRPDGPPTGPRPFLHVQLPIRGPAPLSADFARDRAALVTAWDQPERGSHIMDCTMRVPVVRGDHVAWYSQVPYAIYLPADYLDHPLRRRAVLLLASGGAGSRTRWFLPPLRSDGAKRATGGLDMQARMDAWARAHPEAPPPLVVSIDGPSAEFVNGMAAFIDHELPDHVLSAYLPHQTREQTPYGVEAVSSGAVVTLRALRGNPHLFDAVGLTSLYCARSAFDPRHDLGEARERGALFAELAARRESGLFDLRLSVGAQDQYWECNYELLQDLRAAGVISRDAGPPDGACGPWPWHPTNADPPSSPAVRHCAGRWPAFESWPKTAHNYRALIAAFPSALEWNLDQLEHARRAGSVTREDTAPRAAVRAPPDGPRGSP